MYLEEQSSAEAVNNAIIYRRKTLLSGTSLIIFR